jgi:hypothetical protein
LNARTWRYNVLKRVETPFSHWHMNWRILICACILTNIAANAYIGKPTPEARLTELRALLDTLEPGMGCVTLEGAVVNSDLILDSDLPIGLNPAAQSEEIPDFSGFNLSAALLGAREDESIRVAVNLAFAYIPATYTGWPAISTGALDSDEPGVSVYVNAFLPRPNRRTEQRLSFRFNPSGDVYLQAVRRGDHIEYRIAFDFSVANRDGEMVQASGAIMALQDYETQMGNRPTPADGQSDGALLPCPID